jgi:hypothetical protein
MARLDFQVSAVEMFQSGGRGRVGGGGGACLAGLPGPRSLLCTAGSLVGRSFCYVPEGATQNYLDLRFVKRQKIQVTQG